MRAIGIISIVFGAVCTIGATMVDHKAIVGCAMWIVAGLVLVSTPKRVDNR